MDRTMAKRKMLLKKMLNGHHMSAAGGDSLAAGGTKRDAVVVSFLSVVAEIQKQSPQTKRNRFPGFRWPPRCEDDNPRDAVARNRSLTSGYSSVLPGLPFALSSFLSGR